MADSSPSTRRSLRANATRRTCCIRPSQAHCSVCASADAADGMLQLPHSEACGCSAVNRAAATTVSEWSVRLPRSTESRHRGAKTVHAGTRTAAFGGL